MSSFIQGVSGSLFGALPAMNPVAVLTDNSGVANLTSVGTRRACSGAVLPVMAIAMTALVVVAFKVAHGAAPFADCLTA